MIDKRAIKREFVDGFGWQELGGLPGDFSVSPDSGNYRRVFSADIKIRQFGRMLLGVIGIYSFLPDNPRPNRLGLSAYITNFDAFLSPPVLDSHSALHDWITSITQAVCGLPSSPIALKEALKAGKFGMLDADVFLRSSPSAPDFIRWITKELR